MPLINIAVKKMSIKKELIEFVNNNREKFVLTLPDNVILNDGCGYPYPQCGGKSVVILNKVEKELDVEIDDDISPEELGVDFIINQTSEDILSSCDYEAWGSEEMERLQQQSQDALRIWFSLQK